MQKAIERGKLCQYLISNKNMNTYPIKGSSSKSPIRAPKRDIFNGECIKYLYRYPGKANMEKEY